MTHIKYFEHVDDVLAVRGTEPGPEHTEVLVAAQAQHEVAPQLGPAPGHKVRSVEVETGFSSHEEDVEALDEGDGVHLAVLDVCPRDHVASVDVPDLQRPILCAAVHVASINGSANNLRESEY